MIISEPHKLLNRSEKITEFDFKMNTQHIERHINDKSILVIGAAGSIGSAVVKKIMKYNPKKLFLVDNNENGLVDLIRFLRSSEHSTSWLWSTAEGSVLETDMGCRFSKEKQNLGPKEGTQQQKIVHKAPGAALQVLSGGYQVDS